MLDTVGFITDLPHSLVDSFKATLDEIHFADVIVHVRDISHPHADHQKAAVLQVLNDIGVSQETLDERVVEVWNKIDLVEDRVAL
jgi:50S ribosomal subunit-associated GTPase HflX